MASNAQITKSVVINGAGFTQSRTGVAYTMAETTAGAGVSVPPGFAGSLTTRTNNTHGIVTTTNAPSIVTNDVVDVYWTGGQRRQMVATVSGSAVTVDGGSGTNLPVASTAITSVVKATKFTVSTITMVNVQAFGMQIAGTASVCQISLGVTTTAYAEGGNILLNNTTTVGYFFGTTYCWDSSFSETNPIAGATTFDTVYVSTGDPTNTATFTMSFGTS